MKNKKVNATLYISVCVDCPYCWNLQEISDDILECWHDPSDTSSIVNIKIECHDCNKKYIVENIHE